MTTAKQIAESIHDTIDESTATIEDIHRSIAELPFDMLASFEPFKETVEDVRDVQARSIKGVYGLVRTVNDRVGEFTAGLFSGIVRLRHTRDPGSRRGDGGVPATENYAGRQTL